MRFEIRIVDDEEGSMLASFYRWLVDDFQANDSATFELRSDNLPPGSMGGAFDAVVALVDSGVSFGSFIVSYLSWRDTRTHIPKVTLKRKDVFVDITTVSANDISRIVARLTDHAES